MDVIVRKPESRDIYGLVQLNNAFNGKGCTVESMADALDNNTNEIIFCAVADNAVVGFICGIYWKSVCYAGGNQGIITELIVHESHRRNGIASKLTEALEAEFVRVDVRVIVIETPVNNTAGRRFYENAGYIGKTAMKYEKSLHYNENFDTLPPK
jgi:ribosomal protein S18 acetylase RimI-like enzyme